MRRIMEKGCVLLLNMGVLAASSRAEPVAKPAESLEAYGPNVDELGADNLTLAEIMGQIPLYSNWSFAGIGQLLELPSWAPEGDRMYAQFEVVEDLKGAEGIITIVITQGRAIYLGPWEVGARYHFTCKGTEKWLGEMMSADEWGRLSQSLHKLRRKDIERWRRQGALDKIMHEDLDQLREQLKEEQRKGNLTRQEVREKMLERMKYYQDQEEPQIIWD